MCIDRRPVGEQFRNGPYERIIRRVHVESKAARFGARKFDVPTQASTNHRCFSAIGADKSPFDRDRRHADSPPVHGSMSAIPV